MSVDPVWLQRLQQATTYRELQAAFDQMWNEASSANVDPGMVDQIDEAIRRIEQERIRDEAELAEFNGQYASFKDQNAGVVGWFKRKMPFTATRKQDVELRDTMRDQEAEILADNFVIALAQMLKESLLPPTTARCGNSCNVYREQMSALDCVARVREFGNIVLQMSREIPQAEQFIAELRADIDAFANAKFSDKYDADLKKAGLEKAQAALDNLVSKVDDKKSLVSAAEDRLRKLVGEDLAQQDPAFSVLQQRLGQLGDFIKQTDQAKPVLEAHSLLLGKIKQKVNDLSKLREKVAELQKKLDKAQGESRSAESALRQADSEAQPITQRYEATRQAAEEARLRVEATQPLVEAYLSEQGLDLSAVADQACTSSVCAEYMSLKAAADKGREQLQPIAAQYESARSKWKQRQTELDKLVKSCGDHQQELSKLNQEMSTLQSALTALCDQYRMAKNSLQSSISAWMSARAALNWHPQLSAVPHMLTELSEDLHGPMLINSATASHPNSTANFPSTSFPSHLNRSPTARPSSDLKQIEEVLTRFISEFTQTQSTSRKIQQQLDQERIQALRQRSRILFDGELANRIFG